MLQLKQETRVGELRTPLGKDKLVLTRFDGDEGLSELFEYRIEAVSRQEDINFDDAIGQNCSVTFKTYGGERHFNGILVEAQWLGVKDVYYAYRLVLRPWLWLLSRTSDCRIFSHKKAPDIIKEVLKRSASTTISRCRGTIRSSNTACSTARPISPSSRA